MPENSRLIVIQHVNWQFFDQKDTPWKTNISPKKGTISIGNTSSNHQFSGDMLVLGSVFGNPHGQSPMVTTSPFGLPQQMALPPQAISLGARPNAPLSTSRSPKMVSGIGEGLTLKKKAIPVHREETCGVQFNGTYFFVGKIWKTSHLMHLVWWFWGIFFTNYKAWEVWKNSRIGAFPR